MQALSIEEQDPRAITADDAERRQTDGENNMYRWKIAAAAGWGTTLLLLLIYQIWGPGWVKTDIGWVRAHRLPEMYGKVKEKTIWLYWDRGELPPISKLCYDTIQKHKGSFDVRLLHQADIHKYVSPLELPFRFKGLRPAQQKDALMNALLARYGGVAMDLAVIMFRPIDHWWDEMVKQKAVFRGFVYNPGTVVWFLMGRREGLFRSAVTAAMIGLGVTSDTDMYKTSGSEERANADEYFSMGDGTLTPIIGMYDYDRQQCFKPKNTEYGECYPPLQTKETFGEELGKDLIMVVSPYEVAQLSEAGKQDSPTWKVTEHEEYWKEFVGRYKNTTWGPLPFLKMFGNGGAQAKKLAKEKKLLEHKESFLCHWLCVAGTDPCNIGNECGGRAPKKESLVD